MKSLFAIIALIMLCVSASAIDVSSASTVYLYGEAKDLSVKIVNSDDALQQFEVDFSAPTQIEINQASGTIAANRSKTISVTIYPRSDLEGQTYQSKLEVTLGNQRYVKKVNLVFRGQQEQIGEEEPIEPGPITIGFFGLAMPEMSGELALNIILILIAAILLIAFIARFVKRMEGR